MLTQNDIETRLNNLTNIAIPQLQLLIDKLQSGLNAATQEIQTLNTAATSNPSGSGSTGGPTIFNIVVTFFKTVTFKVAAIFSAGLSTSLIFPPSNGTAALKITKADGVTSLVTFDSTNDITHITGLTRVEGSTAPPSGVGTEVYWDGSAGGIQAYDRTGAAYQTFNVLGSTLQLGVNASAAIKIGINTCTIGFFGGTPAAPQTLAAYSSNHQGSVYSGIATGVGGSPYANVADLNNLRNAYETLRAMCDDFRTKLQTTTLVS